MKERRFAFSVVLPGACLLLLGAFIFQDFLFGNLVLLYKDVGADSLNDYYPCFVHLSEYLRMEGFPSWSFYVGMGQDLYYFAGYLILQPVTWLPRELIAPGLVYQHLAKMMAAGLLFFRYLQLRGLSWPVSFLGASLLAGSGYMCTGVGWYTLADEVVCFAALLLAAEIAVQQGRWLALVLAVALVGLLGSFHLYLCALFLLLYVPARLYARDGWAPRTILRNSVLLAGAAFLGVGLGAVITLPNLYALLHSPRGSGATSFVSSLISHPVFGLEGSLHYVTAVLRAFGNDAVGRGDEFRGWGNYLEAPLNYCGLLCLVMVPQVALGASRRQRIVSALFGAGLVIPTLFPWFRYLFWLFQGDYYRAYSLFLVLGVITLSMVALCRYGQRGALNIWVLAGTTLLLLGVLYLPIKDIQDHLKPDVKLPATIFIGAYSVLLAAGHFLRRHSLFAWLITGLAMVELIRFDQAAVANRNTTTKQELKEPIGYNDETVDAVRDIRAADNSVFRITKIRPSGPSAWTSLNDAMIFNFYGTSSYSSFNNLNYTNFLTAVEAMSPNSEAETRWCIGVLGNFMLSMFAGEKYALAPDPVPYQKAPQYEFMQRYGKDYLFRNKLAVPFGLTFDHYLPEELFRPLPTNQKQESLLGVVVLSDKALAQKEGLRSITVAELEQEMKATSLPAIVEKRRQTALNLTSFRQTHLEGSVRLDQKSVLVLQTPFDRGWRAMQDEKMARTIQADGGLLGVILEPGEHKVTLNYTTPFLGLGLIISLVSCLLAALIRWRWARIPQPV